MSVERKKPWKRDQALNDATSGQLGEEPRPDPYPEKDPRRKLNQSEILNSLILNIQTLSAEDKKVLLGLFNEVSLTEVPSISDQLRTRNTIRVSIDRAILKILGFSASEIETILDKLYPSLYEEIQKLKSMVIRENLRNDD